MASHALADGDNAAIARRQAYSEKIGFDRIMALLGLLFICGLFLDGWAHNHHFVDNTFFTPWHAVLYSAYACNALALAIATIRNHARGRSWLRAIPRGYELAVIGIPLFLIAGVGDLIWHTLFGFEVGIAPLLSPTHLVLALSGTFIQIGPLRAAWLRHDSNKTNLAPPDNHKAVARSTWGDLLPALISLAVIYSAFSFFTQFANTISLSWLVTDLPADDGLSARGIAGILLMTTIMMGILLLAMKRWPLPIGSITLILALNFALMSVLRDQEPYILLILVPSLIGDFMLWRYQPSEQHLGALRVFGFIIPFAYFLTFFLSIMIFSQIAWTIHLWLGSVFMAGILGLLMTYLVVPPAIPSQSEQV